MINYIKINININITVILLKYTHFYINLTNPNNKWQIIKFLIVHFYL